MIGRRKHTEPEATSLLFLLRVWRVQGEDGPALRAAVKSRHDGLWLGFASLDALVATLQAALPAALPAQAESGEEPANERKGEHRCLSGGLC